MNFTAEIVECEAKPGELTVWSLGGAGFVMKSSDGLLLIDAFLSDMPEGVPLTRKSPIPFAPSNVRLLDLMLVTHEHLDHCDRSTIEAVAEHTDALIVGPSTCTALAHKWGLQGGKVLTMEPGDSARFGAIEVRALEYSDPGCVVGNAYLIGTQGITAMHLGDSFGYDKLEEYGRRFNLDVAFVSTAINPPGKTWYMGPEEACRVAKTLDPRFFVPMHWNITNETCLDPKEIERAARRVGILDKTRVLDVGEKLTIGNGYERRGSA
jgi:L-ascorbate metabolism protein UlaG (beta-lactamase superfamily)